MPARLLGIPEVGTVIETTRNAEIVRYEDLQLTRRDRRHVSVEAVGNRYQVGTQPVIQFNVRDISPRKESARAHCKFSEERFRLVVESVRDYAIFQIGRRRQDRDLEHGAERLLGWQERGSIRPERRHRLHA